MLAYHALSRDRLSPTNHNIFLEVNQPFANHNGGDIAFGPDGWLYVGLGDGGGEGDPLRTAQNPHSRLGKILRLNVSRRPAPTQIYALGLRNPWRFSFDRGNGDLWIGDVGQSRYEEIDRIARGTPPGVNLGWSAYEGYARYKAQHITNPLAPAPAAARLPAQPGRQLRRHRRLRLPRNDRRTAAASTSTPTSARAASGSSSRAGSRHRSRSAGRSRRSRRSARAPRAACSWSR